MDELSLNLISKTSKSY